MHTIFIEFETRNATASKHSSALNNLSPSSFNYTTPSRKLGRHLSFSPAMSENSPIISPTFARLVSRLERQPLQVQTESCINSLHEMQSDVSMFIVKASVLLATEAKALTEGKENPLKCPRKHKKEFCRTVGTNLFNRLTIDQISKANFASKMKMKLKNKNAKNILIG